MFSNFSKFKLEDLNVISNSKTVKKSISFNGVALHSGLEVNLTIKPAEPNFGIVFKRIDTTLNNLVYPNFMNVTNTSLNTTVENEYGTKFQLLNI